MRSFAFRREVAEFRGVSQTEALQFIGVNEGKLRNSAKHRETPQKELPKHQTNKRARARSLSIRFHVDDVIHMKARAR